MPCFLQAVGKLLSLGNAACDSKDYSKWKSMLVSTAGVSDLPLVDVSGEPQLFKHTIVCYSIWQTFDTSSVMMQICVYCCVL